MFFSDISRNVIGSKTSKSFILHLAHAQNYKRNCRLFSYQDTYFTARTLQRNAEEDYSQKCSSPNDKLPILIKEPKSLNLDFLCVSETRLLGSDNLEFDDYVLVWFGMAIYIYIYILYICMYTYMN